MARELIYEYRKPGFPKTSNTEKSYKTTIEYVGPLTELQTFEPPNGTTWGDFFGFVSSTILTPLEGTDRAELTVDVEYNVDSSDFGIDAPGSLYSVTYEVEWVSFERDMIEHPKFRLDNGGTYELAEDDIVAIERWKNEESEERKKAYQYMGDTSPQDLTANAKMLAKGINLGQNTYTDFAPVIRKTSTYINGLPPTSTAGLKEDPPEFSGRPKRGANEYEWRKSADRSIQVGSQNKWDRVEEWMGAEKVLHDRDTIYWTAPT